MATLKNTPRLPQDRERIVSAAPVEDDSSFELKLRPQRLAEFIGQSKVKENLAVAIDEAAAKNVHISSANGEEGAGTLELVLQRIGLPIIGIIRER